MCLFFLEKQQIVVIFDISVIILGLLAAGVNIDEYEFVSSEYDSALGLVECLHEDAIHLDDLFLRFLVELDHRFHQLDVTVSLTLDQASIDLAFKERE